MEKSGYGRDGIYRSLRPPLVFPTDPNLSMVDLLFRNSNSYSDRLALIDADTVGTLNFQQFKSIVAKVAHGLIQLGIRKGDVVLILSPNSIQFPVCFLGIVTIGAIATTVNPLYTPTELSKQKKDSGSKMVITVPQLWDKVKDLGLPSVILGGPEAETFASTTPSKARMTTFSQLLTMAGSISTFPKVSVKQSDIAALLYSSGTTGTSKGVVLTHKNFISAALMATCDQDFYGEKDNVCLCFLPMFHVFGLSIICFSQLRRGNTVISMAKFNLEQVLTCIDKYKVTNLFVAPPVMLALAKESVVNKYNLSSLRQIGCGAAPIGKDLMQAVSNNLPHVDVIQVRCFSLIISNISISDPQLTYSIELLDKLENQNLTDVSHPSNMDEIDSKPCLSDPLVCVLSTPPIDDCKLLCSQAALKFSSVLSLTLSSLSSNGEIRIQRRWDLPISSTSFGSSQRIPISLWSTFSLETPDIFSG